MKILFIGGDHPRHLYYINKINEKFDITAAIIENRENMIIQPPDDIQEKDRMNFIMHFKKRNEVEQKYFGIQKLPTCNILQVDKEKLNTEKVVRFIKSIKPDVVMIFGCGLIKEPLLDSLPQNSINLHLGISPRYRGAATLFWPFYFMEPTFAGSTFHYLMLEPDAGDIIHQSVPELNAEWGIHDTACNVVLKSAKDAIELLKILSKKGTLTISKQKGTGKNFLEKDFKPEHLRVIYDLFNDKMVKFYLEGQLSCQKPSIITQF